MNENDFTIFLVDDDRGVLRALKRVLEGKGYKVSAFSSASAFLKEHDSSLPGCAVFDVSMPDLDGLSLQASLSANGIERPIIFITGVAEIPDSVKAMKAGAVDFLTKPVRSNVLLAAIAAARSKDEKTREHRSELGVINSRIAKLTPREKEVLTCVIGGMLNKQIAAHFGIAVKTIKLHRGRMMQKMNVRTVADLVRIASVAGIQPENRLGQRAH
jgi:FixJ family two-component response regulator